MSIAQANKGKLDKCLAKQYRFSEGVMTLGEYLEKYPPVEKYESVQKYGKKKIHLEYKELDKPKVWYQVRKENGISVDIPKIVYDMLDIPVAKTLSRD